MKENWVGSIHNPLSCHRANQEGKHQKTRENNTPNTQAPKNNTKNQHGRWSADQFTGIWNIQDEMITLYHLRDWYGKGKQERNNKTTKMPSVICEPWSNKGTTRKPRLPPARSLEITECKPHGQHSHRHDPKASNDAVMCMWKVEMETSET